MDDHLFPHGPAVAVLEVVHFVEHHPPQPGEGRRGRVDHVAQHFGGHDDDRSIAVDRVVAREEPDLARAVHPGEVGILLVRQCLQRRGVEGLGPGSQRALHRVLGHHGLAGTGGCGHEYVFSGVERIERPLLEGVQREAACVLEPLPEIVERSHHRSRGQVARYGVVSDGVESAGVVSAGAAVVSVGASVVGTELAGATGVVTDVVPGVGELPRSLFGRRTQISTAVTTTMATRRQHRDAQFPAVPGRLVRSATLRGTHRFKNLPIRMDAS